jgi:hypothetical protein
MEFYKRGESLVLIKKIAISLLNIYKESVLFAVKSIFAVIPNKAEFEICFFDVHVRA